MSEPKKPTTNNLAIALLGSVVALKALEFTNLTDDPTLLRLQYAALVESVKKLKEHIIAITGCIILSIIVLHGGTMAEQGESSPYIFSTDYEALYSHVSSGDTIACFIDYDWSRKGDIVRNICVCRKKKNGDIDFYARGLSYGSIDQWFLKEKNIQEKDFFIRVCELLHVTYIPSNTPLHRECGETGKILIAKHFKEKDYD